MAFIVMWLAGWLDDVYAHVCIRALYDDTQAIALWAGQDDVDHVYSVGSFFHYGGEPRGLEAAKALDISPSLTTGDPMYVIYAHKRK